MLIFYDDSKNFCITVTACIRLFRNRSPAAFELFEVRKDFLDYNCAYPFNISI